MALSTDYTNGELNTNVNTSRLYRLTDTSGEVFFEGTIGDITTYTEEPSIFGAPDINSITTTVNGITPEDGGNVTV